MVGGWVGLGREKEDAALNELPAVYAPFECSCPHRPTHPPTHPPTYSL